jgi:hypothetical protein
LIVWRSCNVDDHGILVLVWLRGLRNFCTKIAQPPRPFPTGQPRAGKIKPKSVRTLHEESRTRILSVSNCSLPNTNVLVNYSVSVAGWHIHRRLRLVNLGGVTTILRVCSLFPQLLVANICTNWLWPSSFLIASLVPLIAVGEVKSSLARRRGLGKSTL